jgi:hypothetical protein
VAYQVGALAPVIVAPGLDARRQQDLSGGPTGGFLTGPQQQLPFNWRHAGASFIIGFLVAALLGLQVQQWRRPRRPAEPAGDDAAVQPTGGATHVLDPPTAGQAAGWPPHPDRPEGVRRIP